MDKLPFRAGNLGEGSWGETDAKEEKGKRQYGEGGGRFAARLIDIAVDALGAPCRCTRDSAVLPHGLNQLHLLRPLSAQKTRLESYVVDQRLV